MTKTKERIWLLIAMLFAACICAILFPSIVAGPGFLIPKLGGDGGKNIFAYLYHVLYDKGIWFTGMNYPYGEHIVYTDGQPFLSVILSYFKHTTITEALGIMSWCIVLSYFLAIIYVYKILRHFNVLPFIAMLFASVIIVMSPQLLRTLGHFGLSYACVIPMLFYWTIQYDMVAKWKYPVYMLIMGFIAAFLHPYQSALLLMWVAFYSLGYFIFNKQTWKIKVRHLAPLWLSIVLLLASISIIIRATDPLTDRPVTPYGFLVYTTCLKHIFDSQLSPAWTLIGNIFHFKINSSFEEGYTYLGFTVIIAVFFSFAGALRSIRKDKVINTISTTFPTIWLFIAFAALVLSMGIPFIWHMEWLVDYLSFMRQFRTLGRFSWIFYYIMTIYGAVVIHNCYAAFMASGRKPLAYLILIPAIALWGYEASGSVAHEREGAADTAKGYDFITGKDGKDWGKFLATYHYKANDFQAILLMPFLHVGSDKLWVGGPMSGLEIEAGMQAGIQLHLPMIDAMMARSSWSQTGKQVKIAAGPYVYKPMLDELPNNKPFLLMNLDFDKLDPDQRYLVSKSDSIGKFGQWLVYACYPDRIKAIDKKNMDGIRSLTASLKSGDTSLGNMGSWYVDHFDKGNAKEKFWGSGAVLRVNKELIFLPEIPVKPLYDGQQYEFSCWFKLSNKTFKNPFFTVVFRSGTGDTIVTRDVPTKEGTDNKGLWYRAMLYFPMPGNCTNLRCRLLNADGDSYDIMDELMVRPADAIIVSKATDGRIMVNNHLLPE